MRGQCIYTSPHSLLPQNHLCNQVRVFLTAVSHCLLPMAKLVALFWKRFVFYTFCVDYSRILLSHYLKLGQNLSTFQQRVAVLPRLDLFSINYKYAYITGQEIKLNCNTPLKWTERIEVHRPGLTLNTGMLQNGHKWNDIQLISQS